MAIARLALREREPRALIEGVCGLLVENGAFRGADLRLAAGRGPRLTAHAGTDSCFSAADEDAPCLALLAHARRSFVARVHEGCCAVCDRGSPPQDPPLFAALVGDEGLLGSLMLDPAPSGPPEDEETELLTELVDDLVLAMQAITRQRAQLSSGRLEALGRLAGGVAHDFNNALAVIRTYCELLADDRPGDPELQEDLDEILGATRRAASLTTQLLALSQRQILVPRVMDPDLLLGEMDGSLRAMLGDSIILRRAPCAVGPAIWADPVQLEQALFELAANARDAMPEGGELRVATRLRLRGPGSDGLGTLDPWVVIELSDTGQGMDEATLARALEPFYTTKPAGLGLGLPSVHGVLEQSGGQLHLRSEPARGTTVELWFPLVDQEEVTSPVPGRAEGVGAAAGGSSILLVEDEAPLRRALGRALRRAGHHVISAGSRTEAAMAVELEPAPFDLLLSDVVLPDGSGGALARELQERFPHLRVLFMTGYTEDELVRQGVAERGVAVLRKPFAMDLLHQAVDELLRERRAVGDQ
jgi:signal transduction histidine kinase/ActR/RegA family two-component response regulator